MAWARATRLALAVLALLLVAPFASAQSQATLAAALEAQYRAAIVRERRLADERELRFIADAETRMRDARRTLASAQGDRAAAEAALETARAEYVRLVNEVELLDATARIEVEAFRAELENRLPEATPELLAAYREFADGDRASAWATLEPLLLARANARVAAARAAAAGEVRQLAQLREVMRINGEATATQVLALLDQAAALDASHMWTHIRRARLARTTGDLERSLTAADAAYAARGQGGLYWHAAAIEQVRVLQAQGRFDEAIEISRRVLEHVQSAFDAGDRDIGVAHASIGDILNAKEDYAGALAEYEAALPIIREIAAANPGSEPAELDLARILLSLGQAHARLHPDLLEADRWGARQAYNEAERILLRLADSHPASTELQAEAARTSEQFALMHVERNWPGARGFFERALISRRRLASLDPTNMSWQSGLAATLENLGDYHLERGRYGAETELALAKGYYEEAVTIRGRLADSGDVERRRDRALSLARLGDVLFAEAQGEIDDNIERALVLHDQCLRVRRELVRDEPQDSRFAGDLVRSLRAVGDALRQRERFSEARRSYEEGLQLRRHLLARDPDARRHAPSEWSLLRSLAEMPNGGVTWAQVVRSMEADPERSRYFQRELAEARSRAGSAPTP